MEVKLKSKFDKQIALMVRKSTPLEKLWENILEAENRAILAAWVYDGYSAMALRAWLEHSKWLRYIKPQPPKEARLAMQALALKHSKKVGLRLKANIDAGTTVSAGQYLRIIAHDTTKQGWEGGGKTAAVVGGATKKMWVRIASAKEPRAHSVLEGKIIGRDELFVLPNGKRCGGPHDWESVPDAAEWMGCLHQIIYLD